MTSLSSTPFDKLSAHGLITIDQRDAVLAHPDYATFAALAQPHQQLLWAYRQGLISHQELDAMVTLEKYERDDILDAVNDQIADEISAHHRHLLAQLLRLGLITPMQRGQLADEDRAWRIESLSEMLVTLYKEGVVSARQLRALRKQGQAEQHLSDGARRLLIMEQVHALLENDPGYARQTRIGAGSALSGASVVLNLVFCALAWSTLTWPLNWP